MHRLGAANACNAPGCCPPPATPRAMVGVLHSPAPWGPLGFGAGGAAVGRRQPEVNQRESGAMIRQGRLALLRNGAADPAPSNRATINDRDAKFFARRGSLDL